MKRILGAACALALLASPAALLTSAVAQDGTAEPPPRGLQTGDETPWIYRGSDVPQDKDWLFGELENGLRYAVRTNRVPPQQASIRIRIDAGSLHEEDSEQGYAHLMEHLSFRESKYLGPAEAIPTWQRLGATFGSDTNAETSPTHTVYKLDLPNIDNAKLEESFRLLSGMIREPVLSPANVATEVPIVLAEKRERGGAGFRVDTQTRETLFAGQRLANRLPIGTEETLQAATAQALQAFHDRWYRPENTVIVVAGDADPVELARLVEEWFGDWQGKGPHVPAPNFGDPIAPAGADPENPLGEMKVIVEPDMPRTLTYAIMRPWRPVNDTIVYNEGLLLDAVGQAIINRRLRSRARSGGSFLEAQVYQDDVSRSTDATFVTVIPLSKDWQTALADTRALIADALATPPTQEEIDREVAEFDVAFVSELEQKAVLAGSKLADQIVQAVDIRETVAAPETVLNVFRGMSGRLNPAEVHQRTKALFEGDVIRAVYVTPDASDGDISALKLALSQEAVPDGSARLAAQTISFDELPPIGEPGTIVSDGELGIPGIPGIEKVEFANGTRAILWANDAEPGRITVKVRFGAGYRAFDPEDAPYVALGEMALVGAGVGELGQEELDRITTGRKMGFDFGIEEGSFTFAAQTRSADVSDQLYLFAAKLGMPRWDESPILRSKAAANLAYDALASSPGGVLNRDLDFLLRNRDPRFITPDPEMMEQATPEGFREVWEPILKQGPVEVLVFGEFDRTEVVETLRRTFGALDQRTPIPTEVASWLPEFPATQVSPTVLTHRGDPNQAAAVIAWPSGGGIEAMRESRQLEILTQLFNNRLMDVMREKTGASYAPQVVSDWPKDLAGGGTILAVAQLKPEDVPVFFAEAEKIAAELSTIPPEADELNRVTEPLRQLISRASTGNNFWLYQLEGASFDQRRIGLLRSLLSDYSQTTPEVMQFLARRYLSSRKPWQLAIIPEGQSLATTLPAARVSGAEVLGR